jgi:hypothetical protein
MTYFQLCLRFFIYIAAFSAISLVAATPDGYVIQVGEVVGQAEFLHMNVTQQFGGKLFARQCSVLCEGAPIDPSSIKLNLF